MTLSCLGREAEALGYHVSGLGCKRLIVFFFVLLLLILSFLLAESLGTPREACSIQVPGFSLPGT